VQKFHRYIPGWRYSGRSTKSGASSFTLHLNE
jgi:hypothetical protein